MARPGDRSDSRRPLQVMEKTLTSITGAVAGLVSQYSGFTRDFQLLVKAIGEARTKHEEERIIRHERRILQEKLRQPEISAKHMREFLVRLVYCEMLGHDVSFGHIHALKFIQSSTLLEKRIGYLAVSLLLHQNHELIVLLINSLQKDLKSPNILEISMALNVITKLIGPEMIPAVLPAVVGHLNHQKEIVKKKSVLVLHRFYQCSPSSVSHLHQDFRRALCDKDPGVMDATLNIFHDMARGDVTQVKDLTSSFVSILKQVVERKLPREFDYHGVPAPWVQVKILRILALLGVDDLRCSECMYEVISLCMARADPGVGVGYAIIYECIRTVTAIYPNSTMIERCAKNVGRLLSSPSNNLKYLGINALSAIVTVNAKFAMEHQLVVIECLDDPDETLKRKTLELLCRMTNPSNVEVICEKLISYLRSTVDSYLRSDLVERITLLAEHYAPDNEWFIWVMNSVFELGGGLVRKDVAQNLMRLIAEGSDDDDTDNELRLYAVSSYLEMMERPNLPDVLIQIIAWVLGEYSYLSDDITSQDVLHKLCALLDREYNDSATRGWILTATLKLVSQMGSYPIEAQETVEMFASSASFDLQQRCCEIRSLSGDMKLMQEVMPVDASCEDLEVDPSLSFLNGFVTSALSKGAAAYQPVQLRVRSQPREYKRPSPALNFQPYAAPTRPVVTSTAFPLPSITPNVPSIPPLFLDQSDDHSDGGSTDGGSVKSVDEPDTPKATRLSGLTTTTKASRLWTKSGYLKKGQPATVAQPREDSRAIEQDTSAYNTVHENAVAGAVEEVQVDAVDPDAHRQELASALFSGVGSTRSPRFSGVTKAPRQKPASKPRQVFYKSEHSVAKEERHNPVSSIGTTAPSMGTTALHHDDLLGLDLTSSSNHLGNVTGGSLPAALETSFTAKPKQNAAPPQSSIDLLLDLQGLDLTNPVSLAPMSTTSNVTGNADAGSIGGAVSQTTSEDQLLLETGDGGKCSDRGQAEPQGVGFSFMSKTKSPSPPASHTSAHLSLLDSVPASIGLPDDLKQYPCATTENQNLCSDSGLRVCCRKVYSPSELIVVLFLTNQKSNQLLNVTTQLEMPANLEGTLVEGSPGRQWKDDISGFTTIRRVVKLTGRQPGVNMSLRGQVAYSDTTQQKLFFSLTIHINDLLRPMPSIGTDEFGRHWSSGSWHDKKLKIMTAMQKPEDLMEKIKHRLNLHAIQIIGKEGIAAGSFLQTNVLFLVHGKALAGGHVELWIKTGNSLLTELAGRHCQSTF